LVVEFLAESEPVPTLSKVLALVREPRSLLDTHLTTEGVFKLVLIAEMCEAHLFI
jgi:hypothetical protein